jgi:hypothetical protein
MLFNLLLLLLDIGLQISHNPNSTTPKAFNAKRERMQNPYPAFLDKAGTG